jgi:hypothetical protein
VSFPGSSLPILGPFWDGVRRALRCALTATLCTALCATVAVLTPAPPATAGEDPPEGRWRLAVPRGEGDVELTEEQVREMERLRSIGYLTGSRPAAAASGVTVNDESQTYAGFNFYTSGHFPGAVLMDMDGTVIHTWERSFLDVWPEERADALSENAQYWRYAHLFENGDVLAIFEGYGLVKLNSESRIIWEHYGGEHHDLKVLDDGTICVLTRQTSLDPRFNPEHPVLEDFVTFMTPDGDVTSSVSVLEAVGHSRYARLLMKTKPRGDVLHTNAVELLDGRLVDVHPAFRAGNVLVSMRTLSVVAIIDMTTGLVDWAQAGSWTMQHDPSVLDNGNILLFDNNGNDGRSRVIEIDPATGDVKWEYKGEEPDDFYSQMCGAATRLPNGNTLATESDAGRAIEVTPDGAIVWEYLNPERAGSDDRFVATLFEMMRLDEGFPLDWLKE